MQTSLTKMTKKKNKVVSLFSVAAVVVGMTVVKTTIDVLNKKENEEKQFNERRKQYQKEIPKILEQQQKINEQKDLSLERNSTSMYEAQNKLRRLGTVFEEESISQH